QPGAAAGRPPRGRTGWGRCAPGLATGTRRRRRPRTARGSRRSWVVCGAGGAWSSPFPGRPRPYQAWSPSWIVAAAGTGTGRRPGAVTFIFPQRLAGSSGLGMPAAVPTHLTQTPPELVDPPGDGPQRLLSLRQEAP